MFAVTSVSARRSTSGTPLPSPAGITVGPDGNLWFAEQGSNKIGRMDPSGALIAEYHVPTNGAAPTGIAAGADGAVWFTEYSVNKIGRITTDGTITEYDMPTDQYNNLAFASRIIAGPDGALWFTEDSTGIIGRVTTTGSFSLYPLANNSTRPSGLTVGPDGAVWFTETNPHKIGRIGSDGSLTEYPSGSDLYNQGIAGGADGGLWFTGYSYDGVTAGRYPSFISRMATNGSVTNVYPVGENSAPTNIASGPDGALWYIERNANKIGRTTTDGTLTEYSIPSVNAAPFDITAGPDDALWFTEPPTGKIGRIDLNGNVVEYQLPVPPAIPTNLSAASPAAQPVLTWDADAGADSYNVYRDNALIGSTSTATYIDTTATAGDHFYYVTAVNVNGESASGNVVTVTVTSAIPAPTNLSAPSPTKTPALSWDAVVGANSYNVYRDGSNVGSSATATYTDTTAADGTHSYYVTAVNASGESDPSNTIAVAVDTTRPVVTVTPVAGSTLSGTVAFTITVSDNNPLDINKNKSTWVYLYHTTGTQKSVGAKVNLSSGTGTFTVDTTKVGNGAANLDVGIVYDAVGNASGTTDNYFRNYMVNN